MDIMVALHHVTDYKYDKQINLGPQIIRLRPAPHNRSHIQSYSLKVQPGNHFINWQQDPFGNYLARVVFPAKTKNFRVEVDLVTQLEVYNPFDFFLEEHAEFFPFKYTPLLKEELAPYLEIKESGPLLLNFCKKMDDETKGKKSKLIEYLFSYNDQIYRFLDYSIRLEAGIQSCEETLTRKNGSCRDMAWLLCQMLRHHGLAARFVSGYLIQLKPDVKPLDGPPGPEKDFTDLHAWTEVYLPGAGWVGLDPTSGLFAGEGHIPLCCTPTPLSAAPISGILEPCQDTIDIKMEITRLHQEPRTTKPYTDADWKKIDALGLKVDNVLKEENIRLTMGGEPTFVSLDNKEGDEWNFSALGKEKSKLGKDLLLSLKKHFSPKGLIQFCQGKWYSEEEMPRWAMYCYRRKDGDALWDDHQLLATPTSCSQVNLATAKTFLEELSKVLSIPPSFILPAMEDISYYLWKENRLSVNKKMTKQKEIAIKQKEPTGYVLPLLFSRTRKRWISNKWKFKCDQLTLITGDSPVGFRLPLSSLPDVKKAKEEIFQESSFDEMGKKLPKRNKILSIIQDRSEQETDACSFENDPNGLIKSALCVEIRDGNLCIFLPILYRIEHFIDLIASIEKVARNLNIPVTIEGYPPPMDIRIERFSITPDPGVLEVNTPPSSSWKELKKTIFTLYDEAQNVRLSTDKFLLDGRRVGTGGGNHIVLGGIIPQDSPFLRKPDLLRSFVTFWQNHPSLSYLFSSQYIGPTSQSPRIDEARHDSLYELEIAFQNIPEKTKFSFRLIDRLFRNLLVDLTGNTHRAEFCIDKLYSPDNPMGKLGLLEMRGFDMPPHPQMHLVQALLIRTCVALFWTQPYCNKFIAWGTRLHDKYMLPQFIIEDFKDVIYFLKVRGFPLEFNWFEPFVNFRFPVYGSVEIGSILLELSMALEPWPVLGEEVRNNSVSRSVDTSVERLQVKVKGMLEGRHILTCNHRVLPLHHCEEKGVFIAGVRYKAWTSDYCLHPTIPVQTPLVFDIIDTYNGRSIGGCTYHVTHPGGRAYDRIPINENEAKGRRLARFQPMGHTPGSISPPPPELNTDFPYTLDLRRLPIPSQRHPAVKV